MKTPLGEVAVRPLETVSPEAPAEAALRCLLDACSPDVAVVDRDGNFLGIVTDSELLKAALNGSLPELRVEQIMHRQPQTLTVDQTLADAARLFRDGSLSRAPVLCNGQLAGIVRRCDVLRALTPSPGAVKDDPVPSVQFLAAARSSSSR
jgi:CBS domain-containing protein